jgi:PAS domain S-box-containing protein
MNALFPRIWPLRAYLGSLLAVTALLTFLIVGATFLFLRIPQLEAEIRIHANNDAGELALRIEAQMAAVHERMELLAAALDAAPPAAANGLLDSAIGSGRTFGAIYLVDAKGRASAAGLRSEHRHLRDEFLGSDLKETIIVQAVGEKNSPIWGDKYLSALTGSVTIGFAMPMGKGRILLAEIPLSYLLVSVRSGTNEEGRAVWIVDRRGELLADTEAESRVGSVNLYTSPLLRAALAGEPLPPKFEFAGRRYYVGGTRSSELGWFFIARVPAGLDHPEIRMTVVIVLGGFLASLLVGALFSMFWAKRLLQPLSNIVTQAHQVSQGQSVERWPRGRIAEFNHLSADIEEMANAILERERKALAIFNASPVPLLISRLDTDSRAVDINQAWISQFKRSPQEVIGHTGIEFDLWVQHSDREAMLREAVLGSTLRETSLRRGDGQLLDCRVLVQSIEFSGERYLIWAMEDVTDIRRAETELRELNAELELRVKQRTQSLEFSNQSLTGAMGELVEARQELTRKSALLEATVENISQGISMFDGEQRLMVRNQKFLDLLALPDSLGRTTTPLAEIFRFNAERGEYGPGEVGELVEQRLEQARHPAAHRFRRERPDGSVIEVQGTPLPLEIGGFVTTYADVTDLVRAKEQAECALADLKIAQQQLVQAEKMAALGKLVAGVAHELNTPLGNALCLVTTLEEHYTLLSSEVMAGNLRRSVLNEFLEKDGEGTRLLRNNIERAATLVRNFKQIAVDQANEVRRQFDLAESIENVLATVASQFRSRSVKLETELQPGILMDSYPGPLGQVVIDLVLNALIHGFPEGMSGRVRISSYFEVGGGSEQLVKVTCEDDGCGMPPEILTHIFDPFFTTKLGQGGSGLGLHISHNVVNALLGGGIEVSSAPGKGARFTIRLPCVAPGHANDPNSQAESPMGDPFSSQRS